MFWLKRPMLVAANTARDVPIPRQKYLVLAPQIQLKEIDGVIPRLEIQWS